MSDTTTIEIASESMAEVLARLGDVPLDRLRTPPSLGTATEIDLIAALEAPRKRICELIDGILVEKAVGFRESLLGRRLVVLMELFVYSRNLGILTLPDGMMRLAAGRVRAPDIAFVSWDRIPNRCIPTDPVPDLVPDLAVEILSEGNTPGEMRLKREDYFRAGTVLVWQVDPRRRQVSVYAQVDPPAVVLMATDMLMGDPVLPGFALPLADLFAELDRHG